MSSSSSSSAAAPDWASTAAGRRGAYLSALVGLSSSLGAGPVPLTSALSPAVILAGGLPGGSVASLDHVSFTALPDGSWRPSSSGAGLVSGAYLAMRGAVLESLPGALLVGWLPAGALLPHLAGLPSTRLWCSPAGSVFSSSALSSAPSSVRLCELPDVYRFDRGGVVPGGWMRAAVPAAGVRGAVLDTVAPWARFLLVT